jgi:uncharacterized protein
MQLIDTRTGLERLDRDECLELLASEEVGRLAIVDFGSPTIFPVNYVMDGDTPVFRTDPGTKLDHGPRSRACFEVDAFDRATRTGWSVIVFGRLEEVTGFDGRASRRVRALPIDPWAGGEKQHWMRVVPDRMTGRRIAGS